MDKARMLMDKKERTNLLESAISEMGYVQQHASSQFVLQPQASYYIGQMYELMGNSLKAINYYQESIRLNPKPSPAYAALSEIYRKQNNISEAKKIIKIGLKHSPSSKKLNKLLHALEKK
ncbi:tetratricopeptide repeat protein [Methylomicrobium sp. RS1]|uniref:tetratricopeptide repeat protein n=1 Tax=Candidatus Methylomicrobium oryzae TaxID=2802053 RepID=UPI001923988B|nr:tetratricopeptide repeat protein [Methylomicrobium sp. RS1]MBL1264995.1 tetratricopeptide repeat protein [Methylomicrobium sp. RS1]